MDVQGTSLVYCVYSLLIYITTGIKYVAHHFSKFIAGQLKYVVLGSFQHILLVLPLYCHRAPLGFAAVCQFQALGVDTCSQCILT